MPETPKGSAEDAEKDAGNGKINEMPDVDDSNMHDDALEFYEEVDEAMSENDHDDQDPDMVAIMDI